MKFDRINYREIFARDAEGKLGKAFWGFVCFVGCVVLFIASLVKCGFWGVIIAAAVLLCVILKKKTGDNE